MSSNPRALTMSESQLFSITLNNLTSVEQRLRWDDIEDDKDRTQYRKVKAMREYLVESFYYLSTGLSDFNGIDSPSCGETSNGDECD